MLHFKALEGKQKFLDDTMYRHLNGRSEWNKRFVATYTPAMVETDASFVSNPKKVV